VRVLSGLFRRLFLTALADAHAAGRLAFFGEIAGLCRREVFAGHLAPLRRKTWLVYPKPPLAGPESCWPISPVTTIGSPSPIAGSSLSTSAA
jgi:hypothetical protein